MSWNWYGIVENLKKRATIPFLNKFLSLVLTKTQKYKAGRHFFWPLVSGGHSILWIFEFKQRELNTINLNDLASIAPYCASLFMPDVEANLWLWDKLRFGCWKEKRACLSSCVVSLNFFIRDSQKVVVIKRKWVNFHTLTDVQRPSVYSQVPSNSWV